MKKKLFVAACLILCSAVIFGACSGGNSANDIIYEEDGKIYYRAEDNSTPKELVTDDEGVTVVDENGNMIWKFKDTEGKEQTAPVSFPALIVDGGTVECQQFAMKLPRGWESIGAASVMIKDVKNGHQIDYSFLENDDGTECTVGDSVEAFRNLYKSYIDKGELKIETELLKISGKEATKVVISGVIESDDVYLTIYLIQRGAGVMSFICGGNGDDIKTFDYLSILNSIEYR